jgi:hypothetical protein
MKRVALILLFCAAAITFGGCASTPTKEQLEENARLTNTTQETLTLEELDYEKARLQMLTREQLIAEKLSSQTLTPEQRLEETKRLQDLSDEQLIVENYPPQARPREQVVAENARLQKRVIDEKNRLSKENADLSKDKTILQTELKEAIRVPVTPQIVNQVQAHQGEPGLGDIDYYTSVPVFLRSALNGGSTIKRGPLQLGSGDQDAELTVLTYSEGGSSSSSVQISKENPGALVNLSSDGGVFSIHYQVGAATDPFLLGFVLNPEKNWYELKYLGDSPLDVTGDRPYLLINYQTIFSGAGEARTQIIDRSAEQAVVSQGSGSTGNSISTGGSFTTGESISTGESPAPAEPDAYDAYDTYTSETVYPEDNWLSEDDYGVTDWTDDADYVLVPADPSPPPARAEASVTVVPSGGNYFVIQVGSYQEKKNADAAYAALVQDGFNPRYENYHDLTRVVIPAVEPKDLARTRERVKALGLGEPYVRQ